MKLEPTNLKNTDLGGFWNFAFMSESCSWEDAISPFKKTKIDNFLQIFSEYLRERPYLTLDPDTVDINIPDLNHTEREYLRKGVENIIKQERCRIR